MILTYLLLVMASGQVDPLAFARLLSFYLRSTFALWLMVGLLFLFGKLCLQARKGVDKQSLLTMGRSFAGRLDANRGVMMLWPPFLFATLMASFNAFKQAVLPLAGFSLDPALAALDQALFFGIDPWRVTHAIFASPEATQLIDRAYHGWFVPMSVGVIVCAWLPASSYRLRTQYLLSFIMVWTLIGSLLAFAFPSAGPCFYSHFVGPSPSYDALMSKLAEGQAATGSPLVSLRIQAKLLAFYGSDTLQVGAGISAMPSVHNALAALFALAAFKLHRKAGLLLAGYAAVIWLGSIHLGWHYALDGIVSIGLTLLIWRLCGHLADLLERPPAPLGVQPAIA